MEFLPTGGVYYPLEALTGVKKAGLKKETGLFETAKNEGKKAAEKEVEKQIMKQMGVDPAQAAAAKAAADAQATGSPSAESYSVLDSPAYEMPPSPGKNIGLAALAAAAVGAFLIFKS
jgi:hypothetical protein